LVVGLASVGWIEKGKFGLGLRQHCVVVICCPFSCFFLLPSCVGAGNKVFWSMLSLIGVGAPEAKADPSKPMCAVSNTDQKNGVAQGQVCKVKFVIPRTTAFEEKV
jgi:hypothetical protein